MLFLFVLGHEVKSVAWRVRICKVINGSHEVASVRGREGMLSGVGIVLLLWPCVGVRSHLVLSQLCHKVVIVQGWEGMLFLFIIGHELKSLALGIKSHSFVNGIHKIASVLGREGVSSVVGIVLLLWSRLGFLSHCVVNQLCLGGGVRFCCCCQTCSMSAWVKLLISCRLVPGGMWSGKEVCAGASVNGYHCHFLVVHVRLLLSSLNWR